MGFGKTKDFNSKNEEILINLIDQDDNFSGSLKYFYNVEKLKAILLEVKQNKYIQSTKKYDIKMSNLIEIRFQRIIIFLFKGSNSLTTTVNAA